MYCARTTGYIQLRNIGSNSLLQNSFFDFKGKPTAIHYFKVISKPAYIAYRKEIFHLMTDVFEVDVVPSMSRRDAKAAADVPRPTS